MKLLFFSFSLLIALASWAEEVRFDWAVEPLGGDILQNTVWDFSRQNAAFDNARMSVSMYGDSLLSERFDGRSFWYCTRDDSLSFIGEEDRLTLINLNKPAFIAPIPLNFNILNCGMEFVAGGHGGGRQFDIYERGTLEFASSSRPGILILSPGDTIPDVLAVRERRDVVATFSYDADAPSQHLTVETYRWYSASGMTTLLPLAVQRTASTGRNGSERTYSMAYLPSNEDIDITSRNSGGADEKILAFAAIEAALQDAFVTLDGRTITGHFCMPQSRLTVTLDIVDAAGHLYMHKSSISSGENDEIKIDCSGLRIGQYIAVIGVEGMNLESKKQLIIIL